MRTLANKIVVDSDGNPEKAMDLVENIGFVSKEQTYADFEETLFTDIFYLEDGSALRIDADEAYEVQNFTVIRTS